MRLREGGGLNTYFLCGLKVASNMAFPELEPWRGAEDRPADLEFGTGVVSGLAEPDHEGRNFQAKGKSAYIRELPMVGRILIADGRCVIVQPRDGVDETRVRTNIIGTLQAVLWHQRGLLPLHASAIAIGNRTVLIAGQSGDGKSVLAAALTQLGQPLLCDDLAVIDTAQAPPRLLPGYQRVRLWQDACEALDVGGQTEGKAHATGQKFVLSAQADLPHDPRPVSDILILQGPRGGEFSLKPLGPIPALKALLSVVHMADAARALGRQAQIFNGVNALVAQGVRIQGLTLPDGLDRVGEAAAAVIAAMTD